MAVEEFEHEYDLDHLQAVTPEKRDFQMLVPPRLASFFAQNANEEFSADLLLGLVRDGTIFIDVGAHCGYYTLLVGTKHPGCRIISFEPVPETFEVLKQNIELNHLTNVEAHNLAISSTTETKRFNVTEASDCSGFYVNPITRVRRVIDVEAVTLDSFLNEVPKLPIVIKIDVEGHEIHVLEGMNQLLRSTRDVTLIVEFNPKCLRSAGYEPSDLLKKILEFGFKIYFIDDDKRATYGLAEDNLEGWRDHVAEKALAPGLKTYINLLCVKNPEQLSELLLSDKVSNGQQGQEDRMEGERSKLLSHLIEGQKVLQIGCGTGNLALEIARLGFDVLGIDVDKSKIREAVRLAKQENLDKKAKFKVTDAARLKLPDNSFDTVLLTNVLEHIRDYRRLLEEAVRVVRNGGRVIISIPNALVEPFLGVPFQGHLMVPFKDSLTTELSQYTDELTWHELPSGKWLICSFFVRKPALDITEGPLVDIMMPTCNGRKYVRNAVKSVINQTYRNWNLIVINDGGEDIKDIVDEFHDARIKYIVTKHRGKAHALNVGIRNSTGEFIGYVDDDDILYPIHLEVLVKAALENGKEFVYADWYEVSIDENGKEIEREFLYKTRQDVTPAALMVRNYINHKCILHTRHVLAKVGLYDEALDILIDWDMIRRLSFICAPYHLWSVTSERRRFFSGGVIKNRITGLYIRDPAKALKSIERIAEKTMELPATEKQAKEGLIKAMLSFGPYHYLEFDNALHAKSSRIDELEAQIRQNHKRIDELEANLKEKMSQISSLEAQIQQIHKSIATQLVNRCQKVVEKLLPNGTRRRYYYELLLAGVRVLLNEGWQSFWAKFRMYLKMTVRSERTRALRHPYEDVFCVTPSEFVSLERAQVAVVVHAHYAELFEEVCLYLRNMPVHYTLLVSVTSKAGHALVAPQIERLPKLKAAEIKVVENRGRNIAPLLIDFGPQLRHFDYVCHVHTKRSLYTGKEQVEWRKYLYEMLLGSPERIMAILSAFETKPWIGIIYPETFENMPYWAHTWLSNKHWAAQLLEKLGLSSRLDDEYIDYPVGSMFWARREALQPLLELKLKKYDFPPECGQIDGTLHHAIERCFAIAAQARGLRHAVILDAHQNVFSYRSRKNIDQYLSVPLNARFTALLQSASVVSFDIFDTLLCRPFANPDMVFRFLEEQIAQQFGVAQFYDLRKKAENLLRSQKGNQADVKISEIYTMLAKLANISPEMARRMLELEVNTEARLLLTRREIIALANKAKDAGKRIILASDTYLESEHVEKILAEQGIDFFDQIYISCEVGKRKDRGDLWEHILKSEGVPRTRLLHVGDNEQSDIQALVDGRFLPPLHIMRPAALFRHSALGETLYAEVKPFADWRTNLLYGLIANWYCLDPDAKMLFRTKQPLANPSSFGYVVFGPIVFSFLTWLIRTSLNDHIEHLKFVSRAGFLLHQAYNLIANHPSSTGSGLALPKASYFLCSRRTALFNSLRDKKDLPSLVDKHFSGTLKDFFCKRLSVSNLAAIERRLGDSVLAQPVALPRDYEYVSRTLESVADILLEEAQAESEALLQYCLQQGMLEPSQFALVDIGYSASIQKGLGRLLGRHLAGYYFVTDSMAKALASDGAVCRACFGEFVDPLNATNAIYRYSLLLEAVLTAPHGQLVRFQNTPNGVVPVYKKPGLSQKEFPVIEQIHSGILSFVQDLMDFFGSCALDIDFPKNVVERLYEMAITRELDIGDLQSVLFVEDDYCNNGEIPVLDWYARKLTRLT